MLKLESGTPRTALTVGEPNVNEIFLHPEFGIHVRGSFGIGRVGLVVAHGTMALYDQESADEVDRLCAPPIRFFAGEPDPRVAQEIALEEKELLAKLSSQREQEADEVAEKASRNAPESPLVGPKIRHGSKKKLGGLKDL